MNKTDEMIERLGATDLRDKLPDNLDGVQYKKRDVEKIHGMVWHQALSWATIEQIHKYDTGPNHMSMQGLQRISYTIGVRRSGEICVMNDLETKTWSQGYAPRPGDENAEFIAVLFEGLFKWVDSGKLHTEFLGNQAGEPTVRQLESGLFVWDTIAGMYNWGIGSLHGHFDFGKASCPGKTLEGVIRAVRGQFDFSDVEDQKRFRREYGFGSTLEFQKEYNSFGNPPIAEDGIWGNQSTQAANWWVQHRQVER